MRESRWSQAVTLVVVLCPGWVVHPPVLGGNLAVNGSFEIREPGEPNKHIDTLTPDREDLVGWQVTGKSVDWIGPTRWKASHGEHCLDIDAPGGIKQTLNTTPGRYTVGTTDKEKTAWLPVEPVHPIERLRQLGARACVKDGIVREVDLTDSPITDTDMEIFRSLSSLEHLTLNGCRQLTDAGLAHLSSLSQLRLLSLHGVRMTDAGVPPLTELSNLEVLTLSQTQVTDAGLLPLTKLPKLNDVDLTGTNVTQAGADKLKRALPNCRVRFQVAPPESEPIVE